MSYSVSYDEEFYQGSFDTVQAALDEAFDDDEVTVCWVGEGQKKKAGDYLHPSDVESLLERLSETAYDECGEVFEDWLREPMNPRFLLHGSPGYATAKAAFDKYQNDLEELTEKIRADINDWADKTGNQPEFWQVNNPKKYTREDTGKAKP